MDSMPPATMTWQESERRRSLANMAAFIPEPHILLIVVHPVPSGSPAPSEAWRAGAWPWPAGSTQPIKTSCTSSGRIFARSTAARIAAAPSSGAAKPLSSPWNAPIGVRAAETMTMGSLFMESPSGRKIVKTDQAAAALDDLGGKSAGLARLRVDVHEAGELLAHLEEGGAHHHGLARVQLALVGDVLLYRRHAAAVRLEERRSYADRCEKGVDRAAVGFDHGLDLETFRSWIRPSLRS